ncbi:MAG: SurA N-terminal domain-containing protein [Pseudomonadota bacterium]
MLNFLRAGSKGLLAKILIGLLVVSFAVWGVSSSLIYGNQTTVAEVGETQVGVQEFRFAYENQLLALSQQFGRRLSQQEADAFGLRQNVLSQVVAGAVLDETGRKMSLGISEENLAAVIAADPAFQDLSGNFSRNALEVTLRQYGISRDDYIESRKKVALRNQLQSGTTEALDLPQTFNKALAQFRGEERIFQYVEIGPEVVETRPEPTDAQIAEYYEANKSDFVAPEYRKVRILKLEASDLARPDEVSEEEIVAAYESRKDQLRTPERRTVEQLVLPNRQEADAISQRLQGGETFEAVVESLGRTLNDISLGTITAAELPDGAVSQAAFDAELNEPTEVIDGAFGPVILRVTQIQPEATTKLEDIRDQVRDDIALRRGGDRVFEFYDLVEEERGAGETLETTASRLELQSSVIEMIDRNGLDVDGNPVDAVPNIRALVEAVFQSEPGDDTPPLELGASGFLWYEVTEIIEERQKELAEVKDQASDAWINAEVGKKVASVADTIKTRIDAGEDFAAVAGEVLPTDSFGQVVSLSTSKPVKRGDQDTGIDSQVIEAGFDVAEGSFIVSPSGDNEFTVFKVVSAKMPEGEGLTDEEIENINLAASVDMLNQLVEDLQSRETVIINQSAIEAAFNPGGGHGGM